MITFQEPPRSPMEITWSLFGIRVRISPTFFLISAIIAYLVVGRFWIEAMLVDIACILFAILFTGMVQGIVYRSYGIRSSVVIQDFGHEVYPEEQPPTTLQRIVAALACPVSSFMLHALVYYSNQETQWALKGPLFQFAYFMLWIISLIWGIIGLLPIFPYSGGRVMMEVLCWLSPARGLVWTLFLSIVLGIAYIAYTVAVYTGNMARLPLVDNISLPALPILAIFMGITTMRNFQLLQSVRAMRRSFQADDYGDRAPWER